MDRDIVGRQQDEAGLQTAVGQTVNDRTLVIFPPAFFQRYNSSVSLETVNYRLLVLLFFFIVVIETVFIIQCRL